MVFPVAHIGGCAVWLTGCLVSGATLVLTEYVEPATVADLLRTTG